MNSWEKNEKLFFYSTFQLLKLLLLLELDLFSGSRVWKWQLLYSVSDRSIR